MANQTLAQKRIEIPLAEYNLLREIYEHFRRQALLLRITEAEENLKKKKIKEIDIDKFIKNI